LKEDVKKIAKSVDTPSKAVKNKAASKAISVSQSTVTNLRVGQHPGKTRIVLDLSGKTSFQTRLENGNKVLVVSLPSAVWGTDASAKSADQSLFAGYTANEKGSGSVLKIALSAPSKLVYKQALKPSGDFGNRIVLDIVSR